MKTPSPSPDRPLRIAMWSGPRNISTALLRSWGNRADTTVCDEPFYACYLLRTGVQHPGAADVLASHENDWRRVVAAITGPVPDGKAIFYQKHMAHHLLPEIELDWLPELRHCFLLRHPREMLLSLDEKYANPRIEDTGLPQQVEIFDRLQALGATCPVIDAGDLLADPRAVLSLLCQALGVPFLESMLSWPPGPRATDGVWAKYWYQSVEKSCGFQAPTRRSGPLPPHLEALYARCMECYEKLHAHRLKP
jgi:hypothetical protein